MTEKLKKQEKPKKVKKTKEERKVARDHFWWRMSLMVKKKINIQKELDSSIENQDIKKLNVLLKHVRMPGSISVGQERKSLIYAWGKSVKEDKKEVQSFLGSYKEIDTKSSIEERSKYLLIYAVIKKNYKFAQVLLDQGQDPNYECSGYYVQPYIANDTPLHRALKSNDDKMVKLLLDNGADVNYGAAVTVPIGYIIQKPSNLKSTEAVLKFHSSVKQARKCLDLLLEHKPNLNFRKGEMLALAAEAKDSLLFEKLLEHGADINIAANLVSGEAKTLAFMKPYIKASRTGWHLMDDENMVVKVSYAEGADISMREVFNLEAEVKTVQIGDAAPTEIPFSNASVKQVAKAREQQAKLLQKIKR